jgi:hypothetical protein
VASVRCFPIERVSRAQANSVHGKSFVHQPNPPSVASVASVRCFPVERVSRAQANSVRGKSFAHQPNPPSVTSVASVRCFSTERVSRAQGNGVPAEISPTNLRSESHPPLNSLQASDLLPGDKVHLPVTKQIMRGIPVCRPA